jgi:DNA-3-methyladenine glycosylase II
MSRLMHVSIHVDGPFSLAASTRFLEGFAPAGSYEVGTVANPLTIGFPVEGEWSTVAVSLTQSGDHLVAEVGGSASEPGVREQLARIFSLDVDGSGFPALGRADPVVDTLQRQYPGLRPVGFWSPYEAAAWAVIGHRIRIVQAAKIKQQLAERYGQTVTLGRRQIAAFPSPRQLRTVTEFPGLNTRKVSYLHGIADAALAGELDGAKLRAMPVTEALNHLQQLGGIGPFSAELILVRGACHPDVFPTQERRLHEEMTQAYQLIDPDLSDLAAVAQRWRPYRSWVALLLRVQREERTHEIGGGT